MERNASTLRLPLFKLVILGVSKLMVQVMWGCPTVGEASGYGVGLPSILIVGVGLCLTAPCSFIWLSPLPLLGRPLCWPHLSCAGHLCQLSVSVSVLCVPALYVCSASLSARQPSVCALMVVVFSYMWMDGRVGWSHTFTKYFILIINFISMQYQTSFFICTAIL